MRCLTIPFLFSFLYSIYTVKEIRHRNLYGQHPNLRILLASSLRSTYTTGERWPNGSQPLLSWLILINKLRTTPFPS